MGMGNGEIISKCMVATGTQHAKMLPMEVQVQDKQHGWYSQQNGSVLTSSCVCGAEAPQRL